MCLARPAEVIKIIDQNNALVLIDKIQIEVQSSLIENIKLGDRVLVHAGFILDKISNSEAELKEAAFLQLADLYREADDE